MQQYFEGRTYVECPLSYFQSNTKEENKIIANERVDGKWKSERFVINNSTFAKMGFKGAKFNSDDMKFNVFIDCYFKYAVFTLLLTSLIMLIFVSCATVSVALTPALTP